MKEIQCSHCGSVDIQKASVIYEGGTSTGSSITAGSLGTKGGLFSTVSKSQTNLAKKMMPPPRMGLGSIIGFSFGILLFGAIALVNLMSGNKGLGIVWSLPSVILLARMMNGFKNNSSYPAKFAEYNKMWYCHKCGSVSNI